MDITQNNSKTYAGRTYCCYNPIGQGKVTVVPLTILCKTHSDKIHLTYYKHFINTDNYKLAGIEYYLNANPGQRKKVNIPGLNFPTKQSGKVTVYLFYSDSRDPVLIYLEYSGGDSQVKGWYQKGDSSAGDNEEWTKVELKDITPENLTNAIDCNNEGFKELVDLLNELGCEGLEECIQIDPEHLGQNGMSRWLSRLSE